MVRAVALWLKAERPRHFLQTVAEVRIAGKQWLCGRDHCPYCLEAEVFYIPRREPRGVCIEAHGRHAVDDRIQFFCAR
jgi:hypothetical protein